MVIVDVMELWIYCPICVRASIALLLCFIRLGCLRLLMEPLPCSRPCGEFFPMVMFYLTSIFTLVHAPPDSSRDRNCSLIMVIVGRPSSIFPHLSFLL